MANTNRPAAIAHSARARPLWAPVEFASTCSAGTTESSHDIAHHAAPGRLPEQPELASGAHLLLSLDLDLEHLEGGDWSKFLFPVEPCTEAAVRRVAGSEAER